ncbi:MAG: hypothetical protein IH987_13095 [Planctomycetes bacterium]|nr:hypothetical protein [Planctomycetota bacterium]
MTPRNVRVTAPAASDAVPSRIQDYARRLAIPLAVGATFALLAALPHRTQIPPRVSSDYCYQLLAANRLYEGLGLTSLQPIAPLQPWEWQYDWGFLTQWPAGYSLLVWGVRRVTGASALESLRWISVASCALALVGWFVWVKRMSPRGVAGTLLAAVAAGCSVTVSFLIDPTTDAVVVALLPYALLLTCTAVFDREDTSQDPRVDEDRGASRCDADSSQRFDSKATLYLVTAGLLAGGLFWIRYASVFIPLGIGVFLLIERIGRRLHARDVVTFAIAAAVPMVILLTVNRTFAQGSAQTQMNLGSGIGFHFEPAMLATAWSNFTALGFYDYHWLARWIFALWPVVAVSGIALWRWKQISKNSLEERLDDRTGAPGTVAYARGSDLDPRQGWRLSLCVVGALFVMLIGATTVFGDKFDYVALERYYRPVRPLYFVLFAMPVLWFSADGNWISRRIIRITACALLLIACSWLVRYEWPRPYQRWLAAERETTPSGYWARCFTPDAAKLYGWLKDEASPELIVVSNFHEFVALETGLSTLPIPKDRATLDDWVARIATARGITAPRVLFVLDPDIKWREYWIPATKDVITNFENHKAAGTTAFAGAVLFEYNDEKLAEQARSTSDSPNGAS